MQEYQSFIVYNIESDEYQIEHAPNRTIALVFAYAQHVGAFGQPGFIQDFIDQVEHDTCHISLYPFYIQIQEEN